MLVLDRVVEEPLSLPLTLIIAPLAPETLTVVFDTLAIVTVTAFEE